MSNLERNPGELALADSAGPGGIQIIDPRDVPLGGPRAMRVRRTLPQRARSLIGAWCFVDHYGPEVTRMDVPPHPHTGLQTVSWLFEGTIEHRDSVGSHAFVRPGELNLMTAGAGISHQELSVVTERLHGAQLWVALPDSARHRAPAFERVLSTPVRVGAAVVRVFIGELHGARSTATTYSPLLGAQVDVPAGATVRLEVDPSFEHGVLVDAGEVRVENAPVPGSHLAYLAPGRSRLELAADTDTRVLLLGGEPFPERIVMWWNFIGRDHDEVVAYREQWQAEVVRGANPRGRFGTVEGGLAPLPAPELPNVRLKPREQ